MKSVFTGKDVQQFKELGIPVEEVERQLECFRKGFPFVDIRKPATPRDGILILSQEEREKLVKLYEEKSREYCVSKFVPASGAASRMFKSLFAFYDLCVSAAKQGVLPALSEDIKVFFDRLDQFAFYGELKHALAEEGKDIRLLREDNSYKDILETLLFSPGLEYGSLPKGLILFHRYPDHNRTAFEEHLAEGAMHVEDKDHNSHAHFTVLPEHMEKFRKKMEEVRAYFERKFGVYFKTSYSVQKPFTDTIAVTPENHPFRLSDGKILFRPGGHGALVENLNDMDADIIFIKNIDNVVPDRLKGESIRYKKMLGGLLISLLEKIYLWLKKMDERTLNDEEMNELISFVTGKLWIDIPGDFSALNIREKQNIVYELLHRPFRVCGMVKNEGEPGGGPFWVSGKDGRLSLQIVESSQINMNDREKKEILSQATHFNPVDLVCLVKDHRGSKYDLKAFVDPETYFISSKSFDGKELKALELPGLWNGSMAEWITLFVEVPASSFHPVKTVNDLLRPEHLNDR
ncbi:MAG TPA: DUF4301 family protein [Bacteroidetes bacterium]|nr:DUF4301 family protein [Bacteroidota bacterium]